MESVISEFFLVTGIDAAAPTNMKELIPYMISILIGVCMVSGVFRVFGKLFDLFMNWSRFK